MSNSADRAPRVHSPSHLPQQPDDPDSSVSSPDREQERSPGSSGADQRDAASVDPQQTPQPHSEPLEVPGNSRVDSAPDAVDEDIEPERT